MHRFEFVFALFALLIGSASAQDGSPVGMVPAHNENAANKASHHNELIAAIRKDYSEVELGSILNLIPTIKAHQEKPLKGFLGPT